jgi:hypothetical protein
MFNLGSRRSAVQTNGLRNDENEVYYICAGIASNVREMLIYNDRAGFSILIKLGKHLSIRGNTCLLLKVDIIVHLLIQRS